MQVFKLVNGGFVDRVIVFDSLPDRLVSGIRTREVTGFPRTWAKWLVQIGSIRDVMKTETKKIGPGDYEFKYTPIGKEPCFFVLEYQDVNADKDAWRQICEYLRMNVGPEVRLKEKIEEMAVPFAQKPTDPLSIEPEDIPVVPVPSELKADKFDSSKELVKPGETIIVRDQATVVKKKMGRPPKKAVFTGV